MRRYDDPVEVRKGLVGDQEGTIGPIEGPAQFLWHGRVWKVRDVVAHWVETGAWWPSERVSTLIGTDQPATVAASHEDLLADREVWRVEAGVGPGSAGIFDLCLDWRDGQWQLIGCLD